MREVSPPRAGFAADLSAVEGETGTGRIACRRDPSKSKRAEKRSDRRLRSDSRRPDRERTFSTHQGCHPVGGTRRSLRTATAERFPRRDRELDLELQPNLLRVRSRRVRRVGSRPHFGQRAFVAAPIGSADESGGRFRRTLTIPVVWRALPPFASGATTFHDRRASAADSFRISRRGGRERHRHIPAW